MSIERRLAAVEAELTQTRRRASQYKLFALLALSTLTLGATVQSGTPLVLRAKSFEVVDDSGRVVLRTSGGDDGGKLALFDRAGQELAALSSENGGADLVLKNPAGREVFRVASTALGGESVWSDSAGRETIALYPNAQGGGLTLTNRSGTAVVALDCAESGGALALRRGDGSRVVDIADHDGHATVSVGGTRNDPGVRIESTVGNAQLTLASTGVGVPGEPTPIGLALEVKPGQAMAVVGELERAFIARSGGGAAEFALLDRGAQALRATSKVGDVGLWLQDGEGNSVLGVSSGELRPPAAPAVGRGAAEAIDANARLKPRGAAKEALDRRTQLGAMVKRPGPGEKMTPRDRARLQAARDGFKDRDGEAADAEAGTQGDKQAAPGRQGAQPGKAAKPNGKQNQGKQNKGRGKGQERGSGGG